MPRVTKKIDKEKLTGPLKWHGGKSDLAKWIISLMPARCKKPNDSSPDDPGYLHYVEPYLGGGAVLLANDPEGISEVVNDKDELLTNFWNSMGIEARFQELKRRLESTPFSETLYREAVEIVEDHRRDSYLHRRDGCFSRDLITWAFFVVCRQSLAGRMDGFASISRGRTRRGMNEQVSAWLNCIDGLPAVHSRLKRVLILNRDALDVIRKEDGPRTLFYLDPPYLHETRATIGEYEHEMTEEQHGDLLEVLGAVGFKGRFMLSGYHSELYDDWASACGWKCHEKQINNHAAGGKVKRVMTECVWTNY